MPVAINGSGTISGVPGSILQVQSTTKTDTYTTTSTSFADITGLSVAITPRFTSSKVLVMAMISGGNDAGVALHHLRLMRDSTPIAIGDAAGSRRQGTASLSPADTDTNMVVTSCITFLDSPNTTSATTYKVQSAVNAGTGFINRSDGDPDSNVSNRMVSTITVMEIAQ